MNSDTVQGIVAFLISHWFEVVTVISSVAVVIIYGLSHRVTKRDKERPVISKIVKDFLKPTIDKLKRDKINP